MNALLNINDNKLNIILQSIYFGKKCNLFYIGLLIISTILILATIFGGSSATKNPFFLALEFLVNLCISIDFIFRVKLAGLKKFYRTSSGKFRWWNFFDTMIVISCSLMFIICVILNKSSLEIGF